jgi:hypothetical protein
VRGVSIIAEDVWDLTALHTAWRNGELRDVMSRDNQDNSRADARAPMRKLWHASGGSAG